MQRRWSKVSGRKGGDLMDLSKINNAPSEGNCSNCSRYLKEIAELKEAFIEADYQSVRQCAQLKDEISESDEDCSYTDEQLEDAKAEIKRLKAERSSEKSKQEKGVRGGWTPGI